ncbi:transcriptional regulator [Ruegeria phage DSS3-P1]|uniref:transcriptional regulator n=1 Tax=Ruegeria phage DSS3-P1 TaxID=1555208 RepID=UPI00051A9662|nr:transcriptional regulator [Ruegeria phage DSS3-P1]YP_009997158.1 transcriptional regulator [Ruegeria phage vB_RpoS-V16]YP_009997238.1 transcriptional regulator [Ruegeria phage vB_RpoS-V18]YP_009997320.1 transcriptional regulator [Ruegeria phage vB_RpoS-V11]YP_009997403.1 transcriptional regulator [Ruegeria phage vB_RpoS-V7]AIT13256.1 hypothetical protein DSS3P1_21 [Ruegeria phage DSS3-P1]AWY08725.1 hypothetical protein vBRpoSV7_22 [Ruegeria phage vB_RpoS-V7]AWY08897.1 hypothetical protein
MNHEELREARESLGLAPAEAARVLDLSNAKAIYRMETAPGNSMAREAPVRVVRLYRAYLAGYRPDDWPERLKEREAAMAEIEEVRT